jgi:hypothetical protein
VSSRILQAVATHCVVMVTACIEPTIFVGRHQPGAQTLVPLAARACVVTGCRNELCSDAAHSSPCEASPSDACFNTASCERQADGRCGFTMTTALSTCILLNTPTTCEEAGGACAQHVDRNCREGEWLDIARFTCGERLGEGCCKRTRTLSACEQIYGRCLRVAQGSCSFGQWDFTRACTSPSDACCAPPP